MHNKRKIMTAFLVLGVLFFAPSQIPSAAEAPAVIELKVLGNIYEPVIFDHAMHMYMTSCASCHHHIIGMPAEDEECARCHKESTTVDSLTCASCHGLNPGSAEKVRVSKDKQMFHIDPPGLKRAYHLKCLGCHKEMDLPSGCEDCHPKKDVGGKVAIVAD